MNRKCDQRRSRTTAPRTLRIRPPLAAFAVILWACSALHGAATVTFTADDTGTYPRTLRFDGKSRLLTADLSSLPADATIFRAELRLKMPQGAQRPLTPTKVYPEGRPEALLKFIAPRFVGLDVLDEVRAAAKEKRPLKLVVECTAAGVERLEVSCVEATARPDRPLAASGIAVAHRAGQSIVTFTEPKLADFGQFNTGADVRAFVREFTKQHGHLTFRIWRGSERITPQTIARAQLVGECGFFTAWNSGYWQDETDRRPPVRYRVADGAEPVPWGTGIYAHNPDRAGAAYYAVTVASSGQEDLSTFNDGNSTAAPVQESVGQGEPVLQWMEEIPAGKEWMYRPGPLVRLIYTRWEAPPHCSVPSRPIDYLVAVPAARMEPAPVGLHLHCWGGSLNGGYGWWYNAHRGAVLIASNQIPYDWWTGYHECRDTCRTFGDGRVRPFTMQRMLGFLDWAAAQHSEAPPAVRARWPKLDLKRVFTAGNSMGASGAPMYAIRFGDRIAWSIGWVGVHIPGESPGFKGSYQNSYGPHDPSITMPDGRTSPWDWFSDDWWLRNNIRAETGLIIASNGKNDGGIGWPQAVKFARALQETRRPHYYNWGMDGHGTRTRIGANFDIDVRTDQSLPAFTNCTLDENIGTATRRGDAEIAAEKARQEEEMKAGKRKELRVDVFDGDPVGQYNAYLSWRTDDVVDTGKTWEMTVVLAAAAPKDNCRVDITPRRLQKFAVAPGRRYTGAVIEPSSGRELWRGTVTADQHGLVTLAQIPLAKGANRVKLAAE